MKTMKHEHHLARTCLQLLCFDGAISMAASGFAEIQPLKAAMLTKSWRGMLAEVDQKVGIVPELGGTSVGVKRFGPELERRTLCARQFERFYESTFALAAADRSEAPLAKRELVPSLRIADANRGVLAAVYASLASPSTMTLVERTPNDEWSILALTMNPTERKMEVIINAELATLVELRAFASASGSTLRVLADCRATLAGSDEQLGLVPVDLGGLWFRCNHGI